MAVVSQWLGHASVSITERAYAFLEVQHLQRSVGIKTGKHKSGHTPDGLTEGYLEKQELSH